MQKQLRTRLVLFSSALALSLFLGARPAQAQMNTYAAWPYNQGSLFYRYGASPGNPYGMVRAQPPRAQVVRAPNVYRPTRYVRAPRQARRYYRRGWGW